MEKLVERPPAGWLERFQQAPPGSNASVHLDALRGFAAFSVLLGHWRDAFFLDYSKLSHHDPLLAAAYLFTGLGRQWVIVFFVLSGYLVGGSLLRAVARGRWSGRSYLEARLTRLYVVLIPALVLGGAFDYFGMRAAGAGDLYRGLSGMNSLLFDVGKTLTFGTLAGNIVFLQTIALPGMHGVRLPAFGSNGPLWSLSNEFWYYMAFPLFVFFLIGKRPIWKRLLCAVLLIAMGWFCGAEICLLGIPWLMGVSIGYLPALPPRFRAFRGFAAASATILFVICLCSGKLIPVQLSDELIGASVVFLIWAALHCSGGNFSPWYEGVARRAAHSSYTLYLVHLPFLIFVKAALHLPRSAPGAASIGVAVAVLIAILIYAQLVAFCFERNTDRVRAWLNPAWGASRR